MKRISYGLPLSMVAKKDSITVLRLLWHTAPFCKWKFATESRAFPLFFSCRRYLCSHNQNHRIGFQKMQKQKLFATLVSPQKIAIIFRKQMEWCYKEMLTKGTLHLQFNQYHSFIQLPCSEKFGSTTFVSRVIEVPSTQLHKIQMWVFFIYTWHIIALEEVLRQKAIQMNWSTHSLLMSASSTSLPCHFFQHKSPYK